MTKDLKNTILTILCLSIVVLFLLLAIHGQKKAYVEPNSAKSNYDVYKIDDEVKLNDDSEWYVLKKDSNTKMYLYLISKYKVNDSVVDDVNFFVNDTYLFKLCNSLSISKNEIINLRLLNQYDISELYDINCGDFNTSFDTSKFKLLKESTIVDYNTDQKPNSLCNEGFCLNDNTDIRVVLAIPKHFIKK